MPALRFHERGRQINLQLERTLLALARTRQFGSQVQSPLQLSDRLDKCGFRGGLLARPRPISNCLLDEASLGEMVRENLWPSRGNTRKTLFERISDPRVQCLARSTQQHAVSGVLY